MEETLKPISRIDKIRVFKNNIVDKSKDGKTLHLNMEFGDTHRTGVSMPIGSLDDATVNELQSALDLLVSRYNEWFVKFGDSDFITHG